MVCQVCEHPKAFEIMSRVFNGDMTYIEASRLMNIPSSTVWHCFANHWQVEASNGKVSMHAAAKLETTEDFVRHLRTLLKRFIDRVEQAMELNVSAYNESAVTRLSAELRALMRDILEFEGKLQSAPLVQINFLQLQITKLTSFLFAELCPTDREKLMKALPELMKAEQLRAIAENSQST